MRAMGIQHHWYAPVLLPFAKREGATTELLTEAPLFPQSLWRLAFLTEAHQDAHLQIGRQNVWHCCLYLPPYQIWGSFIGPYTVPMPTGLLMLSWWGSNEEKMLKASGIVRLYLYLANWVREIEWDFFSFYMAIMHAYVVSKHLKCYWVELTCLVSKKKADCLSWCWIKNIVSIIVRILVAEEYILFSGK